MLEIHIPKGQELFNESTGEFLYTKNAITLRLKHSLVSISKWESIWHKPYLTDEKKTVEEALSYVKCMNMTQNVPDYYYNFLTRSDFEKIYEYINNPMTATVIYTNGSGRRGRNVEKIVTSELIYYWMIAYNIPTECEKWHLNRLMALINICNVKNEDPKKNLMSKNDVLRQNRDLNAARRAKLKSKG